MRRWIACLGAWGLLLGLSPRAEATEVGRGRDFGIGVAFGSPTSLVAKYFVGGGNALDFGLGFWSYGWGCHHRADGPDVCDNHGFDVVTANVDYLWQDHIVAGSAANLDWHIGAGGRVWFGDGSFSSEQHPIHRYAQAGEYVVRLFVEGPAGKAQWTKIRDVVVK